MAKAKFGSLLLLCQGILVILFVVFVDDGEELTRPSTEDDANNLLEGFRNLHVSLFLGFGLIMTFLRRYSRGMLVHVLLIGALTIQWATLLQGFFTIRKTKIDMTLMRMVDADFAVMSVLVSMGAIMGKCNSLQLLVFALVHTFFYTVNEAINNKLIFASDLGRSILVHVFGAFYGLAVSRVTFSSKVCMSQALSMSSKSEMYAFIGTLFLWTYWPSVNALLVVGTCEKRAIVNTFYSLAACCTASFSFTVLQSKEGKFNIFHLQSSTLAGGIAIGSIAAMIITPWGAVLVGIVGALGSVLGIKYSLQTLRRRLRIHDTRGVFANHGIPGILSALASILVALLASEANYGRSLYVLYPARAPAFNTTKLQELQQFADIPPGDNRTGGIQALYQLACLAITIVLAVIGGLIAGAIVRVKFFEPVDVNDAFDDHSDFEEQNCIDVVSSDVDYDDDSSGKHHDVVHGKRRCMTDATVHDGMNGHSMRSSPNNSTHLLLNNKSGTDFSVPQIRVSDDVEMSVLGTTDTTSSERQALIEGDDDDDEDGNIANSPTHQPSVENNNNAREPAPPYNSVTEGDEMSGNLQSNDPV